MSMFGLGIYKCQRCTVKIILELGAGCSHVLGVLLRRDKSTRPSLICLYPPKLEAILEPVGRVTFL